VIDEIELRLVPLPAAIWGVTAFFPSEPDAVRFVDRIRKRFRTHKPQAAPVRPDGLAAVLAALEFLDARALALLRSRKESTPAFGELPDIPSGRPTAIYVEFHGPDENAVETAMAEMSKLLEACGGNEAATWVATGEKERVRMKGFRHAVPEAVNLTIDERRKKEPALTKLGTDLAVPDAKLNEVLALYRRDLDRTGLDHVIFGHIGENHLHVNILPVTAADYERGRALYLEWARAVVLMGGTVSAEHGIGKLKTALLKEMVGEAGLRDMRALKRLFDPAGLLNPGNLF
jgi:D-lactate dehydrogenase (cytochrome)